MTPIAEQEQTATAYDTLAPHYDDFIAGYAYEPWIAAIHRRAVALGLHGTRALDLACGTGASTEPLIARGYDVVGRDISAGMIECARRKLPAHADRFAVADMRRLPPLGRFDLVLCLDDAINYLLSEQELRDTFVGVASALAPRGVFVFDLNTLHTYRTAFAQTTVRANDQVFMAWRGETTATFKERELAHATVEIFSHRADGLWQRTAMRHRQRHHPPPMIRELLARAGLRCTLAGQHPGGRLEDEVDDHRHIKIVYFARHLRTRREHEEVNGMHTISPR